MMGKFSSWVIGCREYVMAIDVDDRGGLVYRPVMPNRVILGAEQDAPDVPVLYRELRLRTMPEGGDPVWTYDVFDIRDRANPSHRIETAIQGKKSGSASVGSVRVEMPSIRSVTVVIMCWKRSKNRAN